MEHYRLQSSNIAQTKMANNAARSSGMGLEMYAVWYMVPLSQLISLNDNLFDDSGPPWFDWNMI